MKIETKVYRIEGMSCASCVQRVERALLKEKGVQAVAVNLASESASVTFDPLMTNPPQLENSVARIGYRMINKSNETSNSRSFVKAKGELLLLLLSFFLTLPLVLPMLGMLLDASWELPKEIQLLLATPVQFFIGYRFYRNGWRALKNGSPNMDVLVALGTSAAYFLSLYLGFLYEGAQSKHLYFESSAVIITLVLLGKYLERRAKLETTKSLRALESLRPPTAKVLRKENWVDLPIYKIIPGDTLLIHPGDRIPVDATISEGTTSTDESLVTGEGLPVQKRVGDKIISGSLNLDGAIHAYALRTEGESVLAQIIRLMESASVKKAPIQKLVDRVSEIFVPMVILISILTFIYWMTSGAPWETALINSIAVLVIACPCALGLATPTALMVGRGLAASRGILIKDIEALEKAQHLKAVVFDKTGTLTEGRPQLMKSTIASAFKGSDDEFIQLVYSVQFNNSHPLARSVVNTALLKGLQSLAVSEAKIIPGKGSQALINNNQLIAVGSLTWIKELGLADQTTELLEREKNTEAYSAAWVANLTNNQILGVQWFSDPLKQESAEAIAILNKRGLETILLTGDLHAAAELANEKLHMNHVFSEVTPDQKLLLIKDFRKKFGPLAMVGDGINDAPAIAAADIGMAMARGTDAAMGAASMTLMNDSPLQVINAIDISRATYQKIKQNLFWAFIYNAIGIPLACAGLLNPMIAAGAMAFSSVSVITNSLLLSRLRIKGPIRFFGQPNP